MKQSNSLNKLRIEKRSIQSELNALKPRLSRGVRNTRKHQLDAQRVTDYTLRLSKIESQISEEENKLKKLKSTTFSLANTPLCQSMFKTPPKHISEKTAPQDLNETFVAENPTSEAETLTSAIPETQTSESLSLDTLEDVVIDSVNLGKGATGGSNPETETLPSTSNNSDIQDFVLNTIGLGKVSTGGVISKIPRKTTEIPSKKSTDFSSNWLTSSGNMYPISDSGTNVTQFFKNPLTTNWQQDTSFDKNPYRNDDDLFSLLPPISRQQPFLQSISEEFAPLNIPSFETAPQVANKNKLQPKPSSKSTELRGIQTVSAINPQSQSFLPHIPNAEHNQTQQFAPMVPQYSLPVPIQRPNPLIHSQLNSTHFRAPNLAQNFELQLPVSQAFMSQPPLLQAAMPQESMPHYQRAPSQRIATSEFPLLDLPPPAQRASLQFNEPYPRAQPQAQPQLQPRAEFRAPIYPQLEPNFDYQPRNPRINLDRPRDTFLRRLRCIPKFSGDSYAQLKEFIEVIESLFISCFNESEEDELYQQILLQLRGEARNVVLALNNNDWHSIKNKLLTYFAYLANKEILSSQLENARQQENETLSAYADRVRNLLREKNATYAFMTEEQKVEYNRFARRAFSKGIADRGLRNRLITRGASSLEDAIAYAIEAENDNINDIPAIDLYCRKCNRNGHRLRDCKVTINNNSDMNRLISALRSFTFQNQPPQVRNNFMQSSGLNRGYGTPMPLNNMYRSRNFLQNRNWNNRNEIVQNRNWMGNNSMPNRNWNSNNPMPNRNWNNTTANRNWNQMSNQTWNTSRNQNPSWNNNGNNNPNGFAGTQNADGQVQNRQNRNNFAQRQNDRTRQNNFAGMMSHSNSRISSSSENSISEN